MWTYYDNLKVARNAPAAVIKAAYRALSQQYHPDRNPDPDAQRIIRLINEAYDVLGDPVRRAEYDRELAAQEKEEKLAAQRQAAVRKKDDSAAMRPNGSSPSIARSSPPATPPTTSRSTLPPVWARVLFCAVLFAIGVSFTWLDQLTRTASPDIPDVANTSSPWATPPQDPSREVVAPASSTSVPLPVQATADRASVPPAVNPAPVPPAVNHAPVQAAAPVQNPSQPPTRQPVHPAPIQSAPPQSTPTISDSDFIAMMKIQEPDFDRIIRDPDWITYLRWHEGATTIGQIATNAFNHRDLNVLVKIIDTFRLAKNTAIKRGISFQELMEYEEGLIKKLPAPDSR